MLPTSPHLPNHPPLPQSSMLRLYCINTYFLSHPSGKSPGDPKATIFKSYWSISIPSPFWNLQPDEITNEQINSFFLCNIQLLQACPSKCQENNFEFLKPRGKKIASQHHWNFCPHPGRWRAGKPVWTTHIKTLSLPLSLSHTHTPQEGGITQE